ncbi:hypothetical protein ABES38_08745 [Bacillus gobiensis]|uniref:hypothetical protein n=1 Tax=Bacillus gobiensis TaxID=1441095 RepID=UPI003D2101D2
MYKKHDATTIPEDLNTMIWRYMDFTKFVSLLAHNKLFFTRADKFRDPYEGTPSFYNKRTSKLAQVTIESAERLYKGNKKNVLISCWHMNNYESAAMWDLFLKTNEGIAIQTTVGKLMDSFNDAEEDILISKVHYIDLDKELMPEGYLIYPFIHKRKSFMHEQEIRAIHIDLGDFDRLPPHYEFGKNIKVNLDVLIERIYVAPDAPKHFGELVNYITKKYDLDKPIQHSTLYELPK